MNVSLDYYHKCMFNFTYIIHFDFHLNTKYCCKDIFRFVYDVSSEQEIIFPCLSMNLQKISNQIIGLDLNEISVLCYVLIL